MCVQPLRPGTRGLPPGGDGPRRRFLTGSPVTACRVAAIHCGEASPAIAARYTDALASFCERLPLLPFRGRARDDIREGVRLTTFKSRTVVAYQVADDAVTVIGAFHGGQEYDGPSRRGR